MEYALLGFFTGLSLILAIGAQNIFVIEQGLKKQYVFLVCLVCSISDLILIFDVDATLSFCDNKRRRLLSTYHISHKHVKKSTSFDIDLGKPKELKHTAPINNVDRITLTVSGGTNILITVLFVLFVSFACLCYSIHLYMPSYERKRREEEEYNFVSLE